MRMTLEQMDAQASAEYGGPAIGAWPRHAGQRMRPHKGGGGDGGARQMEEDRQRRVAAATETINAIFNNKEQRTGTQYVNGAGQVLTPEQYQSQSQQATAKNGLIDNYGILAKNQYNPTTYSYFVDGDPSNSRDRLYSDQRSAVYDLNTADVNRQAEEAERANRFGLARSGLLGGSVDVDSNADINRRTNEGLMRSGSIADQAAADLRVQDEQTRSNLISLAQSGIDTGTASQMALGGLKANAESAAGARGGATIGGLFNDMSQAYLFNQQTQGAKAGAIPGAGGQWYGVSSPTQTYSGR